ncbi:MAG: ABC transporter ATP-binding protein [Bacilli bacterium]|nr:ABC transporter ATP-binding protein [Bacilli bacterium]MDD3098979.1 ABC transporter ATP-binding protein [Bacilli bacterium]
MAEININKSKNHLLNNFYYALKKVWEINKKYIVYNIIFNILDSLNVFTYSYIIKLALDALEKGKLMKDFIFIEFIIVSISLIISIICSYLKNWCKTMEEDIVVKLNQQFSLDTLNIDYELFEREDLQNMYIQAKKGVSWQGLFGMLSNGFMIIQRILIIILASSIIFSVSPLLIIVVLICSLLKYFLQGYSERIKKKEFYNNIPLLDRKISYCDNISKNLTVGKDMRIYNMNKFVEVERQKSYFEYLLLQKKFLKKDLIISILLEVITIIDELAMYAFLIFAVLYKGLSIANFVFMLSAIRKFVSSIAELIDNYSSIISCNLKAMDYIKFNKFNLNKQYDINDYNEEFKCLEFKNVYFRFYMQDDFVIKNISLKIDKGDKLAIVGYNGAGKTTLIKLMMGLYHPTSGEILINSINIERFNRKILNNFFAPVFQDITHYSLTVSENISLGNDVDTNKLVNVTKKTMLFNKIDELPLKYGSIISRDIDEDGIDLSGGELQKLSIARGLYKNSEIMILDEPTSAIDAISELELYENLNEILNKTAVFISHRLSSVKFCNKVIVMDNGEIVEFGTHEELLNLNKKYAKLFNIQAKYYVGRQNE